MHEGEYMSGTSATVRDIQFQNIICITAFMIVTGSPADGFTEGSKI
jgi:hypothetical protein